MLAQGDVARELNTREARIQILRDRLLEFRLAHAHC